MSEKSYLLQLNRLLASAFPRQSSDLRPTGFSFGARMKDWHKSVYKRKQKAFMDKDEWYKLRNACFKRDKYTCQRCDMKNGQGRGLTAHHIIPKSEDGANDIHNLITLCVTCHDYVEINELRSIASIQGSYDGNISLTLQEPTKEANEEGYHFKRPDWHKYVYGGHKRNEH